MEPIRISKYFTDCGVLSRRAADAAIEAGEVKVNGIPAVTGQKITPGVDEVVWRGRKITMPATAQKITIMLNKPRGYVTTMSDEKGRHTVAELVSGAGVRLYPIGRLDMNSTGLLLLTNDGELANGLMHPRKEINKIYHVHVDGVTDESVEALKLPITLDGYTIRPPKVAVLRRTGTRAVLAVTIHEGRNRQVRRMCDLAGMNVLRLIRISEGKLQLGRLPSGKWRYLTADELELLK